MERPVKYSILLLYRNVNLHTKSAFHNTKIKPARAVRTFRFPKANYTQYACLLYMKRRMVMVLKLISVGDWWV